MGESQTLSDLLPSFDHTALGVHLEFERMGNQQVSDDLQAQAVAHGARFEHLGLTLGTIIHDVDLQAAPTVELTQFLRNTLLERKVIFFRDQHLDQDQHVAFARQFGELDAFPFGKPGSDPYVLHIEHGPNSPGRENGFHTDVTWMERPSLGSVAQILVVPPYGGDTLFSDSHAAYLGLPDELQAQIENLYGTNDYRYFAKEPLADVPFGVDHPLVRTHPETGKRALYIHGGFLRHDSLYDATTGEALDPVASKKIVTKLLAQHGRPEYTCRFQWQPGSLAFSDNRAVQHYAASDYYPHERVLRRLTIQGDRPV